MVSIIGIDSREFSRSYFSKIENRQKEFHSVLGIAIKVENFMEFDKQYQIALEKALSNLGQEAKYSYYCVHDFKENHSKDVILDSFVKNIAPHIEKVHIFYTLFSTEHHSKVKVYGRLSQRTKQKLSQEEISYEELTRGFLLNAFPGICAWRLSDYFSNSSVSFHLDAFTSHVCEAFEIFEKAKFHTLVYPRGDCANPVISAADLLLEVLDKRLLKSKSFLQFDKIRPQLPEFGEKVLVYPIHSRHLHYITPLDKRLWENTIYIKHPVFWLFKGDPIISSEVLKNSQSFRTLVNYAARVGGIVKLFEKGKDIDFFKEGDYGVFLDPQGEKQILTYIKLGKKFKKMDFNGFLPTIME